MDISILIEQQADDRFVATVWGWPECQAVGDTREAALAAAQAHLAQRLQTVEVVTCPMPQVVDPQNHPLVKLAGTFKDDPYFDDMLSAIAAYRQELATGGDRT